MMDACSTPSFAEAYVPAAVTGVLELTMPADRDAGLVVMQLAALNPPSTCCLGKVLLLSTPGESSWGLWVSPTLGHGNGWLPSPRLWLGHLGCGASSPGATSEGLWGTGLPDGKKKSVLSRDFCPLFSCSSMLGCCGLYVSESMGIKIPPDVICCWHTLSPA